MAFTFTACAHKQPDYKTPSGYDLNHPEIHYMPASLLEISGITFYKGNSDTLYAEQDEEGAVYMFRLNSDFKERVSFKKHGDFEDIAICNEKVIMLRSDGVLYSIPFHEVQQGYITAPLKWENILPKGEYEGMYADDATNRIYVLCKNCKSDKDNKKVSGYILQFGPNDELKPAGGFQVDVADIARLAGEQKIHFKPSALTRNRRTKEWYILSSVNKMLVVADEYWNVKEVFKLDPTLFIQPEGITFDKENTLYISNEGSKTKPGTVFKFAFTPEHQ